MEPELVDGGGTLVLELVRPFPAMLVLRVLPLGTNTFLKQVVIGLESEFRDGGDVVLDSKGYESVR